MESIGWVTATGIIPSGGTPCHFIFKQRHDGGIVRKETLKGELVTGVDIVVSAHGRITDFGRLARCILNLELKISAAIDDAVKVLIRRFKRRRHCIGIKFSVKIDFARIGLLCLRTRYSSSGFPRDRPDTCMSRSNFPYCSFQEKGLCVQPPHPG
jgi:hypothetical protein